MQGFCPRAGERSREISGHILCFSRSSRGQSLFVYPYAPPSRRGGVRWLSQPQPVPWVRV